MERSERLDECVLRRILGFGCVAQHKVGGTKYRLLISQNELFVGVGIAGPCQMDELFVFQCVESFAVYPS